MKICPKCNRRFKSSYDTCTPCRDKPIKDKDKKISVVKISKIIIIIFIAISLYYLYDTDSSKIINEHEKLLDHFFTFSNREVENENSSS